MAQAKDINITCDLSGSRTTCASRSEHIQIIFAIQVYNNGDVCCAPGSTYIIMCAELLGYTVLLDGMDVEHEL